jgi:CRP-like cAMP-binding protein
MDARTFLAKVPLFADALDGKQLDFLARESRPAFFLAGTRLMNQGDFGGAMFVIVDGKVSVTFADEDEREQTVATLGTSDVVGEMSLFTGDRRTATVIAATNVDAIEIGKASLERVFAKAPELVDKFAAVLAKRQAQLNAVSHAHSPAAHEKFTRQARKVFAGIFGRGA